MKYTVKQLKEMAEETLFAYHSGDQRADMMIMLLSQITQSHPGHILNELNKLCDATV